MKDFLNILTQRAATGEPITTVSHTIEKETLIGLGIIGLSLVVMNRVAQSI